MRKSGLDRAIADDASDAAEPAQQMRGCRVAMTEPPFHPNDLATIRTELAYQRNRIAVDRTLMAVMRTSLSLISFGFTIFSFFKMLSQSDAIGHAVPDEAPARFGLALVIFGVLLLLAGIVTDYRYMQNLRAKHGRLLKDPALAETLPMQRSLIVLSAIVLLLIGLIAILLILVRL